MTVWPARRSRTAAARCASVLSSWSNTSFLAGEVLEDGGGGNVRRLGDVLEAHMVVAVLQEQLKRGIGDRLPGGGLLALAAADSGLSHARRLSERAIQKNVYTFYFSR